MKSFSLGLAMFAMFFGAGNIIFPLAVGQYAGDQYLSATLGLLISGVLVPFAGVIAMILYHGDYKAFFGTLGKAPGFLISLTILLLLGPLGSTPRCITLAHSALKNTPFDCSSMMFSLGACAVLFLLTAQKKFLLPLLGKVLTPFLLLSLATMIGIGLLTPHNLEAKEGGIHFFLHGLQEGYQTMDLLAAFFFSSSLLALLKNEKEVMKIALKGTLLGAFLLSATYSGLSLLAAFHGNELVHLRQDLLLGGIMEKLAGPESAFLVSISIALACLTTAMALLSVFADFLEKEVFQSKVSYKVVLLGSLGLTFLMSTLEFSGISAFLGPLLEICYPGLILLTFCNIGKIYLQRNKGKKRRNP